MGVFLQFFNQHSIYSLFICLFLIPSFVVGYPSVNKNKPKKLHTSSKLFAEASPSALGPAPGAEFNYRRPSQEGGPRKGPRVIRKFLQFSALHSWERASEGWHLRYLFRTDATWRKGNELLPELPQAWLPHLNKRRTQFGFTSFSPSLLRQMS